MKPKFEIPLQASRQEVVALIKTYAERLYRFDTMRDMPSEREIISYMQWNAERLVELTTLLKSLK